MASLPESRAELPEINFPPPPAPPGDLPPPPIAPEAPLDPRALFEPPQTEEKRAISDAPPPEPKTDIAESSGTGTEPVLAADTAKNLSTPERTNTNIGWPMAVATIVVWG
jgi:hypothetical protein